MAGSAVRSGRLPGPVQPRIQLRRRRLQRRRQRRGIGRRWRRQWQRWRLQTPQGRAELRQRVSVEHRLAHIVYRQADRARYLGLRKNLFDLRRASVVQKLETIHRVAYPDLLRQAA